MNTVSYFRLTDHYAIETRKCFPGFFLFRFHSTFVSLCSSSLSLSLLMAINYTDSLTGWNKEIKHLNIVSWCMYSCLLPNTDIEEILHSSCQLTKLHPKLSGVSISVKLHSFQKNMQGLPSFCQNPSFIIFNTEFSEAMGWISVCELIIPLLFKSCQNSALLFGVPSPEQWQMNTEPA